MSIVSLLKTVLSALAAPRQEALSDHMLRDIGLPERGPRALRPELLVPVYNG